MAFSSQQFEIITSLARNYGATSLILFGSALDNPESARDIDLACDGVEANEVVAVAVNVFERVVQLA